MALGRQGEEIASAYLSLQGYRLLGRNIRIAHDEIDLLFHDPEDDVLVFAEVKTRAARSEHYSALLNITHHKKACLHRAAQAWVDAHAYEGGFRVDVVCVEAGTVTVHLKEVTVDPFTG